MATMTVSEAWYIVYEILAPELADGSHPHRHHPVSALKGYDIVEICTAIKLLVANEFLLYADRNSFDERIGEEKFAKGVKCYNTLPMNIVGPSFVADDQVDVVVAKPAFEFDDPRFLSQETASSFAKYCRSVGEDNPNYWRNIYTRLGLEYTTTSPQGNKFMEPSSNEFLSGLKPAASNTDSSSRAFQHFATFQTIVALVVVWFGGFLLHIWTAYLFAKHWGIFWAIIAFFCPVFSECVATLKCFHWGVWFYILAVAAYLIALLSIYIAAETADAEDQWLRIRKLQCILSALMMYILLGCFGFFAIHAAIVPQPLSENEQQEIEDVNSAICAVLSSCASLEPTVATDVAEAKSRLRHRIEKYDSVKIGALRRKVDTYLKARLLMERDLMAYLQNAKAPYRSFAFSEEAHEAISRLPAAMNPTEVVEELCRQINTTRSSGADWGAVARKLRPVIQQELHRQWRVMGEVYEDILGVPIPSQKELACSE